MKKLELVHVLEGHDGRVWNVSWNLRGPLLASCGEDKTIRIWGQEGRNWVNKDILTEGQQRTIRQVSWSPCGNYVASASFDATIAIWSKKSGKFECNLTLEGHENEVKSVSWSRSGQLLATCSRDKSVWIWEVMEDEEFECAAVLNAHTQDVKKVVWHPHIDVIASASYDNTVKLFKEDDDCDWNCVATLSSHESTVWSLAFDCTGTRIATCSDDSTVKIWREYRPNNIDGIVTPANEPVWKCICTLSGYHSGPIYDISWCHKTDLLATACGDDAIRIFKEVPGSNPNEPIFELIATCDNAHLQDVNSIAWCPTLPGLLASASDDGHVKLWMYND